MNEIIKLPVETGALESGATAEALRQMAEMLASMAAMLQATTRSMEELRKQVRLLEKVTPAQASAINRAVRDRAVEVCRLYMAQGGEKSAAAAIRKALRLQLGARTAKEIPRCDYEVAMEAVKGWDDYRTMMGIRQKARKG